MDTDILRICGIALLCAIASIIVGKMAGDFSLAIRLCGLCILLGGACSLLLALVGEIGGYGLWADASELVALMLKALGIAFLCRLCSDVCRDCGATTIASAVESVGKLTIVALAMPLLTELVLYARDLLEGL